MLKKVISSLTDIGIELTIGIAIILLVFFGLPAGNGTYGLGNVLASKINTDGVDYTAYTDAVVTSDIMGRKKPTIVYYPYDEAMNRISIITNQDIVLCKFFQCLDADGSEVSDVQIQSIKDKNDTELLTEELGLTDTFQFSISGIYTVQIEATDTKNQTTTAEIQIPVNRAKQGS